MSNFNIADVLDFLTPGAVYHREDGSTSRVLFLTNTSLPHKVQAKFPPQVVYADENDHVLSNSVENFLAKRKFYNIDPDLETRLNNLLAYNAQDDDALDLSDDDTDLVLLDDNGDAIGADAPDVDDSDDLSDLELPTRDDLIGIQDEGQYGENDINERERIVSFSVNNPELPQVLDPVLLGEAVESYQQQPSADLLSTQHVLFIKAVGNINADSLDAAFSPASMHKNQTLEFAVDLYGDGELTTIDWSTFIGVYPCVFYGSRMYQVILSSPNIPADIAAAVSQVVAEAAPALNAAIEHAATSVKLAITAEQAAEQAVAAQEITSEEATAQLQQVQAASVAAPAPTPAPVAVQAQAQPQTVQIRVQAQPQAQAPTAMQQAMAAATVAQ